MKKILKLIAIIFLCSYYLKAQQNKELCGTQMPANYKAIFNNVMQTQNLVATLKHDTCLNKKFSIIFYVIADSSFQWGPPGGPTLTPGNLTTCVNNLNNAFKRICVQFFNCSTVVIPHHPYNRWWQNITHPVVASQWKTQDCINIYLVDSIKLPVGASGYAGSEIVIQKSSVTGTTPIHEMGHFFGLIHTFDDMTNPAPSSTIIPNPNQPFSSELVNRSNCYTNGDGFCDTETDCFPFNGTPNQYGNNFVCSTSSGSGFWTGPVDANGQFIIRPMDNYMTYQSACRNKFTQEQYNFMAAYIVSNLLYLH